MMLGKLPGPTTGPALRCPHKLVVLDDDPTGTQTVHDVPVLTRWDETRLAHELADPAPAVFLLTNTRALPSESAVAVNRETMRQLCAANRQTGRRFTVISRSDSTLRGHFPAETDALAAGLGGVDATFLIPAFFPGGRFTVGNTHYVVQENQWLPVAQTEFARDATFGFRESDLCWWIQEKTGGRVPAHAVHSVSIDELRLQPSETVAQRVAALPRGSYVVVNAAAAGDLAAFTQVLGQPCLHERQFLFRTAASFVSAYAAIDPRPLLTPAELQQADARTGGLLVVGSHVAKTTRQLECLRQRHPKLALVTIEVPSLLQPPFRAVEIQRVHRAVEDSLRAGRDTALVTSRNLVVGSDPAQSLAVSGHVSSALVQVVRDLSVRPRWLVAKGGITSSDLATDALQLHRAMVLGQAQAGVPVWECGLESKWPRLPYVIFPGNVGGEDALANLVTALAVTAPLDLQRLPS